MLKHSKVRTYKTKKETCHLMDIYADDLTIYLEIKHNKKVMNLRIVQEVMQIIEKFLWSPNNVHQC